MARALPFHERGLCIDCGEKTRRDIRAWRCWSCTRSAEIARQLAIRAVWRAVVGGEIAALEASVCVDCEKTAAEYDHRDYLLPLNVQPVCRKCNQRRGPANWRKAQEAALPAEQSAEQGAA